MNPSNQDPYMILSLSLGATGKQIKKAYRRLAMKFHPDRNRNDPAMENKFKQILWACERLRKQKRQMTMRTGAILRIQMIHFPTSLLLHGLIT